MDASTMELDDLKSAWQSLDRRLQLENALRLEDRRERKLERARGNLRPLLFGVAVQALLGVGLIVLGVACWHRNLDVPGLLLAGIVLHAFGVLNVAFAGIITGLSISMDYAAPVLAIQKRLRLLLRMQVLNSNTCGAPWWIMWVVVVVGFAGLSPERVAGPTPAWIWASLALGLVGMLATWAWTARASRKQREGLYARMDDGADGIRRSLRMLDDLEEFERR
ncbi:MAG: hypothetical protein M3Y70_00580 [Pseudomonadota bacterium]|nr:hypothetical protein [Pseudomonadota bacterium]